MLNSYMFVRSGGDRLEESRLDPIASSSISTSQPKSLTRSQHRTIEEYEQENAHLHRTVELLTKRVIELERAQQENTLLRSSIMQFRQDLQKQRQLNHQIFQSIPPSNNSASSSQKNSRSRMAMSANHGSGAAGDSNSSLVPELMKKIESLELELASANEQIATQQRKWDRLKENVKKKRESKGSNIELSIMTEVPNPSDPPPFGKAPTGSMMKSASGSSMYYSINPQ
jgi:phosphoenolpyruvate-protein kinase (PTS system EI component)